MLPKAKMVAKLVGGLNLSGYLATVALETHKLTDLIGVGSFGVAAGAMHSKALFRANPRAFWMNTIVMVWSARLSTFLFSRVSKLGEDKRLRKFFRGEGESWFDRTRSFFPVRLLSFWSIQAVWGMLCMLPLTLVNSASVLPLERLGYLGLGISAVGVVVEALADHQKNVFKTKNPESFCDEGLWRFSRHPNYAGELMVWWGLGMAAIPSLSATHRLLALLSPLTITGLLLKVSGVPLLEKKYNETYGDSEKYQDYKRKTPLLFPFL